MLVYNVHVYLYVYICICMHYIGRGKWAWFGRQDSSGKSNFSKMLGSIRTVYIALIRTILGVLTRVY